MKNGRNQYGVSTYPSLKDVGGERRTEKQQESQHEQEEADNGGKKSSASNSISRLVPAADAVLRARAVKDSWRSPTERRLSKMFVM